MSPADFTVFPAEKNANTLLEKGLKHVYDGCIDDIMLKAAAADHPHGRHGDKEPGCFWYRKL